LGFAATLRSSAEIAVILQSTLASGIADEEQISMARTIG
jgi:hypothetical protein